MAMGQKYVVDVDVSIGRRVNYRAEIHCFGENVLLDTKCVGMLGTEICGLLSLSARWFVDYCNDVSGKEWLVMTDG